MVHSGGYVGVVMTSMAMVMMARRRVMGLMSMHANYMDKKWQPTNLIGNLQIEIIVKRGRC